MRARRLVSDLIAPERYGFFLSADEVTRLVSVMSTLSTDHDWA